MLLVCARSFLQEVALSSMLVEESSKYFARFANRAIDIMSIDCLWAAIASMRKLSLSRVGGSLRLKATMQT